MENQLFPIRPEVHIIFAIAAFFIFGMQFIRLRKKFYLVLAIAVPCSLLPYVIEGTGFFYGIGVAEAIALVAAFVMSKTIDRDKTPAAEVPAAAAEAVPAEEPAEADAQEEA